MTRRQNFTLYIMDLKQTESAKTAGWSGIPQGSSCPDSLIFHPITLLGDKRDESWQPRPEYLLTGQ